MVQWTYILRQRQFNYKNSRYYLHCIIFWKYFPQTAIPVTKNMSIYLQDKNSHHYYEVIEKLFQFGEWEDAGCIIQLTHAAGECGRQISAYWAENTESPSSPGGLIGNGLRWPHANSLMRHSSPALAGLAPSADRSQCKITVRRWGC